MTEWRPRDGHGSRTPLVRVVGALTAVLVAAGCGGGGHGGTAQSASTAPVSATPTPTATALDARVAVLDQYRSFWAELTPASRKPAPQRRSLLASVAADPELTSLLRGMAAADSKHQVFYGANIPRPTISSISPTRGVAVVDDCQDSSHAGLAARSTGRKLTIGVDRNHVVATLHLLAGSWRVVFVSYPRTSC